MKRIFRLFCGLAFLGTASLGFAQNPEVSVIAYTEEGASIESAPIYIDGAIIFSSNGIQVLNADKQQVALIPYEGVDYLNFMGVNSVGSLSAETAFSLRENPVGESLEVAGFNGKDTTLRVFDLEGRNCVTVNGWSGQPVNVSNLTPGIYILAIDNSIIKFIKK